MNWNSLDKCWNEFAELNGTELDYNERNVFHAIECKYKVYYQTVEAKIGFSGIFWKSTEGHNRNRTVIMVEFLSDRMTNDFELNIGGINNFFFKRKQNDLGKILVPILKKINGEVLTLKTNKLKIELNEIISSTLEFEKAIELINEVKNRVV